MNSRILKQEERKSLIEKIIEISDLVDSKDHNKTYGIIKGNTFLSINVGYDKMPFVSILKFSNEKKFIDNERKQSIIKNDMCYFNSNFPCCIFLDTGRLYEGSSQGLERIYKVIIHKDLEKKKTNLIPSYIKQNKFILHLIKINDFTNQINEDHRINFDSIIWNYSLLSEK